MLFHTCHFFSHHFLLDLSLYLLCMDLISFAASIMSPSFFFFFLNPQSIISSRFSSSTSLFCNLTSLPFISILMIEPHEGIESAATPHWAYSICVLLPSFSQLGSSSQNTWQSIHHPFHFMPRVCRDSTLK